MFDFLNDLWTMVVGALTLNAATLTAIQSLPYSGWLAACIVLLAGISRLAGDSIALFINRVSPRRFAVTLVAGGVLFVLELALWGFITWIVLGRFLAPGAALPDVLEIIALSSTPWLFGVLVFMPYFGALVKWILRIWSWLIALVLLRNTYDLELVGAFIAVSLGWIVLRALSMLFAGTASALSKNVWTRVTGTPDESDFESQAQRIARKLRDSPHSG